MAASRDLTQYFLQIGVVQIVIGACALAWALPLFFDPPFLSNGLTTEYSKVRAILLDNPAMTETLSTLRLKLEWLFHRYTHGVMIALALGVALIMFGLVSVVVGFRAWLALRKQHGAHA